MTRQRKTRNEIKRENIQTALMAVALMILFAVLMLTSLKIWAEHPAEQPIRGVEYIESIRNGGDYNGNP